MDKPKIITFLLQGRLCNALYEYFATKVLQRYLQSLNLKYEYQFVNRHYLHQLERQRPTNMLFVEEKDWYTTLEEKKEYFEKYDIIVLYGYFQSNDWLLNAREFIKKEIFLSTNNEQISDEPGHVIFKIDQLVTSINYFKYDLNNVLVVHLRLDDFYKDNNPTMIICPNDYSDLICNILLQYSNISEIRFIVDKLRHNYEFRYIRELDRVLKRDMNEKNVLRKLHYSTNNTLEHDFGTLLNAKYVVSSNGTFGFIPIMLGDSIKNWVPRNYSISKVDKITTDSESWDYNCWKDK